MMMMKTPRVTPLTPPPCPPVGAGMSSFFVVSSSTAEQPNKVSEMKVVHANQTLAAAGSVTELNCSSRLHLKEQFNSFLRVRGLSTEL